MDSEVWLKVVLPIAVTTYSVIFGIVAKRVWDVPKIIDQRLNEFDRKLEERLKRIDEEAKLSHRRLNVHDRISSKMVGKDFDSRAIAESGLYPDFKGTHS